MSASPNFHQHDPLKALYWYKGAQRLFSAVMESFPDAMLIVDEYGTILLANSQSDNLFGHRREELIGESLEMLMPPQVPYVQAPRYALEQAAETGRFKEEGWCVRKDGRRFWASKVTTALRDDDGYLRGFSIIARDVTDRHQLEQELCKARLARAHSESAKAELLRTLERISDGFFVLDRDWRYRYINEKGAQYFERRSQDLFGRNIWTEFPEAVGQPVYNICRKAFEEQVLVCEEIYFAELKRWFDFRIYPSRDGLSIMFRDTTDRRQSQQALHDTLGQLRALSARLQTTREEERKQVARNLHDQIGQILTAIKMDVGWVAKHLPQDQTEVRARLESTLNLVRDAAQSVRKICTELRPGVLDDLGLGAAIEWQANEFASRTGIHCEVSVVPEDLAVDSDRSTAIFRIFQEALTNVARHAHAKGVRASLVQRQDKLQLVVHDDGKGILDSDLVASKQSLGLLGMKERAQACGGELQIWGEPGRGTTVAVEIPLSARDQRDSK